MDPRVPIPYSDTDSWLHRLDPRAKICLFGIAFVFLFVAPSWPWHLIPVAAGLLFARVAKTPWQWLAILWAIHLPSLIVILLIPLTGQFITGHFAMTEGLDSALRLTLAWSGAIFISISLISTMRAEEFAAGLRGLGLPHIAALSVALCYRLLFVALEEAFRVADAMHLKGIHFRTWNPITLIVNSVKVALPLILGTTRRAMDLMTTLYLRGPNERASRALMRLSLWQREEWLFVGAAVAFLFAATLVRFG